jgi:hypothetical protein
MYYYTPPDYDYYTTTRHLRPVGLSVWLSAYSIALALPGPVQHLDPFITYSTAVLLLPLLLRLIILSILVVPAIYLGISPSSVIAAAGASVPLVHPGSHHVVFLLS